MNFAVHQSHTNSQANKYVNAIVKEVCSSGNTLLSTNDKVKFVLNFVDIEKPRTYHRKACDEFLVSFAVLNGPLEETRNVCYRLLIATLANMAFCIIPERDGAAAEAYYVTPEVGYVRFAFDPKTVYQCLHPVVSSHLMIHNEITPDLASYDPLCIPEVKQLIEYGGELQNLGLLPAPFKLEEVLTEDLIREVYRLYEVKALSYGNLSVRNTSDPSQQNSFWMTARGVNKAQLKGVGQDILLVTGLNESNGHMQVSVPAVYDRRVRVSVDAIEHHMIYQRFPKINAVVHVHAWIDGVVCTSQNYPCGTLEMANEMIELLKTTDCPEKAEVGLKNHGLTLTGGSLDEIFQRFDGRLHTSIPMFV